MYWIVLLGVATGMRALTPFAVVCWMAFLGYFPVQGTGYAWLASPVALVASTLLAGGEYVGDVSPWVPSRKSAGPLVSRLVLGSLYGALMVKVIGEPVAGGVLFALIGVLIGAFGGYRARMRCAAWVGRDWPVGVTESAVALAFAWLVVAKTYIGFVADAYPAVLQFPR